MSRINFFPLIATCTLIATMAAPTRADTPTTQPASREAWYLISDLPTPPPPDPAKPVNYVAWINETYGADVPEDQNDYQLYKKAYALVPYEALYFRHWKKTIERPWSDNEKVEEWIDNYSEALDLFAEAAKSGKPCYVPSPDSEATDMEDPSLEYPINTDRLRHYLMNVLLPELPIHRELSRGLASRALRNGEKHPEKLLESANLLYRASLDIETQPILITRIMALNNGKMAADLALQALAYSPETATFAHQHFSEIYQAFKTPIRLGNTLQTERLCKLDFLQRFFKAIPGSDKHTLDQSPWVSLFREKLGFLECGKILAVGFDQHVEIINIYYDLYEKAYQTPPWKRAPGWEDGILDEYLARAEQSKVLKKLPPTLGSAFDIETRFETARRGCLITFALHAVKAETGRYPADLGELARHFPKHDFKRLMIDPYTGRPFVYTPAEDSFTLYSFGMDGDDDDGRHDDEWDMYLRDTPDGDCVFWPQAATNESDQ